jgi:hypothetical protein
MKKISIIIICLVASTLAFSQDKEHIEWSKNQLKVSPLRIFNWFNPGLELNYQRNYKNFASQISVAYLVNIASIMDRKDVQGYRLNFEEKCHFPKSYFKRQRTFISCEIGYHNINSTRPSQRFIPKNNQELDYTNSYIDDYKINRQSIIFDVKMGMEFQVKHLLLEWGIGIGIAYQNVRQLNKKNPDYKMEYGIHDFFSPMFEDEGRYVIPNIPITFKIGYTF